MGQLGRESVLDVRLSSILDALSDCLLAVDARGCIRYLNAAWRRFDGDEEQFRIGSDFARACAHKFEPGEQLDALARAPHEVVAGRSQHLELECTWIAAGGRRHGAATITRCEVAAGRGALIQLVDITERRNADAVVRESEARYRSLVDGSPDIVFITDSASRMIYANRALEDQTGYTAADFQMRQLENPFLHPEDAERVADFIEAFVASDHKHSERLENRFITKDGNVQWYSSIISKIQYMGEPALQFVVHNVTEQRRAKLESVARFCEAQEAIRVRDEFLAVAAHELKTPLTSLRGFAQWLAATLESDTPDRDRELRALRAIDRQSMKLARLIDELLDLARLQSGKLDLARTRADLVALVSEAVDAARARSDRTFTLNAPSSLIAYVDPLRFEQVVTNLLDNAVKFSPADKPIEVEVRAEPADRYAVVVRDHGIGIPQFDRDHLFEPFFQGTHRLGGMGLGLPISREIVERHGGTLAVEFPADGGTRMVVTGDCGTEGSVS